MLVVGVDVEVDFNRGKRFLLGRDFGSFCISTSTTPRTAFAPNSYSLGLQGA